MVYKKDIYNYIRDCKEVSIKQIMEYFNLKRANCYKHLCNLRDDGYIVVNGKYYAKWSVTNKEFLSHDDTIRNEVLKRVGMWLETRPSIYSQGDYMNHVHVVDHIDIQTIKDGTLVDTTY